MHKVKSNSPMNSAANIKPVITDVRNTVIFLLALAMVFPLIVYADGLFDFQMKLAQGGNAEAQYKVGEMYETGFGVKKDMSEAEKWITKAADAGNESAGFKLLYWDVEKNGLKGANKAKVDDLIKKAEAGNPQAQYFIGKMHANGVGVKKDSDKAISWLNKAAFVGVIEAEQELIVVREDKQRQALAKRRADEKKRAQLKAKQEKEKQARLEKQRELKAKKEAHAKAKANADAMAKSAENKKKADAAVAAATVAAAAKLKAQKEAEEKQREAQQQAKLKKQAEEEKKQKKNQFESDPCSGKSARFLSTCR